MKIVCTYEPQLLEQQDSSGESIFFEGATGLLIHADNAMEGDLNELLIA